MQKNELIHYHGLLLETAKFMGFKDGGVNLSEYDSLDISPTQVYSSKADHREAVDVLLETMLDEIDTDETEHTQPTPEQVLASD